MTDLLPAAPRPTAPTTPTTVRGAVILAPDGVDPDASTSEDLGPDWSALRGFTGVTAAVLSGGWLGHLLDGPAGVVIGAGLVALVVFVGAHVRHSTIGRRWATRATPTSLLVDMYASTGDVKTRCSRTGSERFVWRCDVCRVVSIEVSTRAETTDLAGTHDRLHHGRPTAAVLAVPAPAVSSTREGL